MGRVAWPSSQPTAPDSVYRPRVPGGPGGRENCETCALLERLGRTGRRSRFVPLVSSLRADCVSETPVGALPAVWPTRSPLLNRVRSGGSTCRDASPTPSEVSRLPAGGYACTLVGQGNSSFQPSPSPYAHNGNFIETLVWVKHVLGNVLKEIGKTLTFCWADDPRGHQAENLIVASEGIQECRSRCQISKKDCRESDRRM